MSAVMRIAYVGAVPPMQGGIAQHGGRVIDALRSSGNEVEVVSWRSQYPALLYRGRTRVERVDGVKWWLRWWNPWSWRRAGRHLAAHDATVIPWVTPFHAPVVRSLLRRSVIGVVIVHNPLPHERFPLARALTRWALRHADHCIVHGESNQRTLRSVVPDVPTTPLHHPPNLFVAARPLPPRPPARALCLGFVRPYKGIEDAIAAIGILTARDVDLRLTVAGELWMPAVRLRHAAAAAGVADRVDLRPGYVPDDEMEALLAAHHLLIAPYRSGTVSGVIPLAFSAGRPVVATRVGSIPEVVADGVTGSLADPADPTGLADAITRVLADLPAMSAAALHAAPSWADFAVAITSAVRRRP
jgi:glycosyltransferase involved in cell wall biosynthesis